VAQTTAILAAQADFDAAVRTAWYDGPTGDGLEIAREFVLNLIPGYAARQHRLNGEYWQATLTFAADVATFFGRPLRQALEAADMLIWSRRVQVTAIAIDAADGLNSLAQGTFELYREDRSGAQAAGHFGNTFLKLFGLHANVKKATPEALASAHAVRSRLDILPHPNASTICFVRSTSVACVDEVKPIGSIEPGSSVMAWDFASGRWVAAEVLKRHDNIYTGAMVTVFAGQSKIEATGNHPFWVVKGHELDQRRTPSALAPGEDEGRRLSGRWVLSQDIEAGDLLFGLDGGYHRVSQVQQRWEEAVEVSNLTVAGHHTFAVGDEPLLVHNLAFCEILRRAKGGFENMPALVAAKRLGQVIHAHHIVPKTLWNNAGRVYIKKAQDILNKYGIDVLYSEHNLTWAIHQDHSIAYVKAVATTLEKASKSGKPAVLKALNDIAEVLNQGRKFRGLP
jgi:hypothetical protein